MKLLTKLREDAGLSRNALGCKANVAPANVGKLENGIYIGYPPERERLADALSYEGNPDDLLKEVE